MKPEIIGYIKQLVVNLEYIPNYGKNLSSNIWETTLDVVITSSKNRLLETAFRILQKEKMKCYFLYGEGQNILHWHYRIRYSKLFRQEQLCNLIFDDLTYIFEHISNHMPFKRSDLQINIKPKDKRQQHKPKWNIRFNYRNSDYSRIFSNGRVTLRPFFILFKPTKDKTDFENYLSKELELHSKDFFKLNNNGESYVVWRHKGLSYSKPDLNVAQRFIEIDIEQQLRELEYFYNYQIDGLKIEVQPSVPMSIIK